MVFRGTYDHTFDAKNRLTVPAKYRDKLGSQVVVSRPTDEQPCLGIWRPEDHEARTEQTLALVESPHSPKAAALRRWLYGNSVDVELDKAGRIMVPAFLIDAAGLGREVVIAGAGDSLEVWNRTDWAAQADSLGPQISDITASLGHPG